MLYGLIPLICVILIVLFLLLLFKKKNLRNKKAEELINKAEYKIKYKYISNCELEFYNTIQNILQDKYILFPQVPLSQIVVKKSTAKYKGELYRVIDFCIFTKDYTPLLCIEINDNTHHQKERYIRDKKVQSILNSAGLPLITLWTEYGVNKDYIRKRINEHIEL